jgi:hypothetical protein
VQNILTSMVSFLSSNTYQVQNAFYNAGLSAGQAFAAAFRSIHIDLPHMYVSGYNQSYQNGQYINLPNYAVQYYAKGTNFAKGGPSVVGEERPEWVNMLGKSFLATQPTFIPNLPAGSTVKADRGGNGGGNPVVISGNTFSFPNVTNPLDKNQMKQVEDLIEKLLAKSGSKAKSNSLAFS